MQSVVTFLCVLDIEEKGARRWEVLLMHSYDWIVFSAGHNLCIKLTCIQG